MQFKLQSCDEVELGTRVEHPTESQQGLYRNKRELCVLDGALRAFCCDRAQTAAAGLSVPPASSPDLLDRLEQQLDIPLPQTATGALIVRALIFLERIHWVGIDERPMRYPQSPDETRDCFDNLIFVAHASASLQEGQLNGLAAALLDKPLTWDQGNLEHSLRYLDHALDMFHEGGVYSPFLQQVIQDTRGLIEQFGGAV